MDTRLLEAAARVIEPAERVAPSEWAERHITLTTDQSEARTGPFSCDWKPWTKDIHDAMYDEPGKKGVICRKPARVGFTRAIVNVMGCGLATDPAPMLFLINNRDQAAFWATEHFDNMVNGVPDLKASAAVAVAQADRRDTALQRPFLGGRADFAGAGNASAVTSRGYRRLFLDEYEVASDEFPREFGDLWTMAEKRVGAARVKSEIWTWSHPRRKGRGIDGLYTTLSDCRDWVFDCPACGATVVPHSSLIKMRGTDDDGNPDPTTAVVECPTCQHGIADHERAIATQPPRLGGTGRFESSLSDRVAAERVYIGLSINGLADPDNRVADLARQWLSKKDDERQLMSWRNTTMGEAHQLAEEVVTIEVVGSRLVSKDAHSADAWPELVVPSGLRGARFVCVGADVQKPEKNPTLYITTRAYSASHSWGVDYRKLAGWSSLTAYLERFRVGLEGEQGATGEYLGVAALGVDCGAWFKQVANYCRRTVYSAASHARVTLLPVRFVGHVSATEPAVMPPLAKQYDKLRPWLGPLPRWDLHRHSWVDREMQRWMQGTLDVLCPSPGELASHITSNVLEPKPDVHRWGDPEFVWAKQEKRRDDYLMAGVYCEAAAALACGLDSLDESEHEPQAPSEDEGPREPKSSWLGQVMRRNSWWNG